MCLWSYDKSLFARYLRNCVGELLQIYKFSAVGDKDELIRFWGQRVNDEGHSKTRHDQKLLVQNVHLSSKGRAKAVRDHLVQKRWHFREKLNVVANTVCKGRDRYEMTVLYSASGSAASEGVGCRSNVTAGWVGCPVSAAGPWHHHSPSAHLPTAWKSNAAHGWSCWQRLSACYQWYASDISPCICYGAAVGTLKFFKVLEFLKFHFYCTVWNSGVAESTDEVWNGCGRSGAWTALRRGGSCSHEDWISLGTWGRLALGLTPCYRISSTVG